jgi:hypothetical protein
MSRHLNGNGWRNGVHRVVKIFFPHFHVSAWSYTLRHDLHEHTQSVHVYNIMTEWTTCIEQMRHVG